MSAAGTSGVPWRQVGARGCGSPQGCAICEQHQPDWAPNGALFSFRWVESVVRLPSAPLPSPKPSCPPEAPRPQLSLNYDVACGTLYSGKLYCLGANSSYQLGPEPGAVGQLAAVPPPSDPSTPGVLSWVWAHVAEVGGAPGG